MNRHKINILCNDVEYSKLLARRLCELSSRLEIITYESDVYCDLIITDLDINGSNVFKISNEDKLIPVSHLFERIKVFYYKCYDEKFDLDLKVIKPILIGSNLGGAGVTSISMVLSREFTLRNIKTLRIEINRTNALDKLSYLLYKDENIYLDDFTNFDKYGVPNILLSRIEFIPKLLSLIEENSNYEYVIIDSGSYYTSKYLDNIDTRINVLNANDIRSELISSNNNEMTVINNIKGKVDPNNLTIHYDPNSFLLNKEGIEVLSSGKFQEDVEIIYNYLINIKGKNDY